MNKKYEITKESMHNGCATLYRIKALIDIPRFKVKKGDLGGWIEKEFNLSQNGRCWVSKNAQVYGDARVNDNARVMGFARVFGRASVCVDAKVKDRATVFACAYVRDKATVKDKAIVQGYANICGCSTIKDSALVSGECKVSGTSVIGKNVIIVGESAIISDAVVFSLKDFITIKNCWTSGRTLTYTRSNKRWTIGCFHGTGEELIAKAYKDSELSGKCYELTVNYVEAIYNTIHKESEKIKKLMDRVHNTHNIPKQKTK